MSNPLSLIRRHQKVLLAVLGVATIVVFTVGGIVTDFQRRRYTAANQGEVVLTWKRGSMREEELSQKQAAHAQTVNFLEELVNRTVQAGGTPRGVGISRNSQGQIVDPGIPRSAAEEDIVRTLLLADKATQAGMVVDDNAILSFLRLLSDDVVGGDQFPEILQQACSGRFSKNRLFDQLRIELLAQNMRLMLGNSVAAMPPTVAWDYFNRLNRRVQAELLPLNVADFVDQVKGAPSDAEVRKLYEEGKELFPNPQSPKPAFKRPLLISFQYLKADYDQYLEAAMAEVTDEQVAEHYEKNKSDFKKVDLPPADPMSEALPEDTEDAEAADAASSDDTPEAAADSTVEEEQVPEAPETESSDSADGASESADSGEMSEEPAPENDAEQTDAADESEAPQNSEVTEDSTEGNESAGEEAKPASEDTGAMLSTDTMLVSLRADQEEEQAAETESAADEPVADASVAADSSDDAAEMAEEEPEETPEEPADAEPTEDQATGTEADTEEKVEYQPLEEVADQIRRTIATPNAQDKMNEALDAARRQVDKYRKEFNRWQFMKDTDPTVQKPAPLDAVAIADAHGLVAGETPLVDAVQISDYELGKAQDYTFVNQQFQVITFAQVAYTEGIPLYQPARIRGDSNTEFLYWKADEQEPYVPELADAREDIVEFWRERAALDLAKEEAQKLADQSKADAPLGDSLSEEQAAQVIETNEFSWMNFGSTPSGFGPPELGRVLGVEGAGQDFMRAVFALQVGQAGVATNESESTVYVVRIASEAPDEEQRREQFAESGVSFPTFMMAQMDRGEVMEQWYEQLEKEMQLSWKRPPRQIRGY